jgi:dynein heavy chain, axonemal
LASVGKKLLAETDALAAAPDVLAAIESFMPAAFVSVNKMCRTFGKTEGKYVYTTPKSYLEMIKLYQLLLAQKWSETDSKIYRLQNGVEKLQKAAADVVMLEANLQIMLASAEEKGKVRGDPNTGGCTTSRCFERSRPS